MKRNVLIVQGVPYRLSRSVDPANLVGLIANAKLVGSSTVLVRTPFRTIGIHFDRNTHYRLIRSSVSAPAVHRATWIPTADQQPASTATATSASLLPLGQRAAALLAFAVRLGRPAIAGKADADTP